MTTKYPMTIDSRDLEQILAWIEDLDQEIIDDFPELRESVDRVSGCLGAYAEANPSFDEESDRWRRTSTWS